METEPRSPGSLTPGWTVPARLAAPPSPAFPTKTHRWQQLGQRLARPKHTDFSFSPINYWYGPTELGTCTELTQTPSWHSQLPPLVFFTKTPTAAWLSNANSPLALAASKNQHLPQILMHKTQQKPAPLPPLGKFSEPRDSQGRQNSTLHAVKKSIPGQHVHTAVKPQI